MGRPKSNITDEEKKHRGERLRLLREMIGFSQADIARIHSMSPSLLSLVERGLNNLTRQFARKMVLTANEHGIDCTVSWLLNGEGSPPIESVKKQKSLGSLFDSIQSTTSDVSRFLDQYAPLSGETLLVPDESMLPQFKPGDYVGGLPIPLDRLKEFFDYPFIVEIDDGRRLLRRITKDKTGFILYGTNFRHSGPSVIINPNITRASPVFWHRMTLTPWIFNKLEDNRE